jgi:hypothetical protein
MPDISFDMDAMHFIWDEDKNLTNIQKHGISFETAAFVFKDNLRLEQMDRTHSTMDEIRYITIGLVHDILTVVYCEKGNEPDVIIRLISARHATKVEKELYNNTMYGRYY